MATSREFFDLICDEASTPNPAFIALELKDNPGRAFAFLEGYVDWLSTETPTSGSEATAVAKSNIMHAATYGLSGRPDAPSFSIQIKELLGEWPDVFDALSIVNAAKKVLEERE